MTFIKTCNKLWQKKKKEQSKMSKNEIRQCSLDRVKEYGDLYSAAFSGPPWFDPWQAADAAVHVKELLEIPTAYCLEYTVDGQAAGLLLGHSQMFHSGRIFEISDLAVSPDFQKRGIGRRLLEQCLDDLEQMGIGSVSLLTASEGSLADFYKKFGFTPSGRVMLMEKELHSDK